MKMILGLFVIGKGLKILDCYFGFFVWVGIVVFDYEIFGLE